MFLQISIDHVPIQYGEMNHEALVQNVGNSWSCTPLTLDSETWNIYETHTLSNPVLIYFWFSSFQPKFTRYSLTHAILTGPPSNFMNFHHQDMFVRDSITEDDILVVDVGGNDVALHPTCGVIFNIILLLYLTPTCLSEKGKNGHHFGWT